MNKILRKIGLGMMAAIAAASFSACSDDSVVTEPATQDEVSDAQMIEVPITFGGDIMSTASEAPLTRADEASNDLYVICVERYDADNDTYTSYTSGVFDGDHIDGLTIKLNAAYTYKFSSTMIRNARNKIYSEERTNYRSGEGISDSWYASPIYGYATDFNNFWSNTGSWPNSGVWMADPESESGNAIYSNPPIDRYYGELDYKPGDEINIKLYRCSFQLIFEVTNLGEGEKLLISSEYNSMPDVELTSENPTNDGIYSLIDVSSVYSYITGEEEWEPNAWLSFKLTWTAADGTEKTLKPNLKSFNLDLYRLKKFTVTITLAELVEYDDTAAITLENEDMDDGGTYTLDKSGLNEETQSGD